jgi:F0F1-type ATP synthase assembly protein I
MTSEDIRINQANIPHTDDPQSSALLQSPARLALSAFLIQAAVGTICSLIGFCWSTTTFLSLGTGVLSNLIPSGAFTIFITKVKISGSDPTGFLRLYFAAEASKLLLTILVLAVGLQIHGLIPVSILIGFMITLASGWLGLAIAASWRPRNGD